LTSAKFWLRGEDAGGTGGAAGNAFDGAQQERLAGRIRLFLASWQDFRRKTVDWRGRRGEMPPQAASALSLREKYRAYPARRIAAQQLMHMIRAPAGRDFSINEKIFGVW